MTLENLRDRLFSEADQAMTLVAHAQAEARAEADSRGEAELDSEPVDLFLPEVANHPGATWLIQPVWEAVLAAVLEHPLIADAATFKANELAALAAGERQLLAMWERLGVTFDDPDPNGAYYIHVTDPQVTPEAG
jgi:hypothetical protein